MTTKLESTYIFRVKKIKSEKGGLLGALRHNKRLLPPENHINRLRTPLNYCLHENASPEDIYKHARKLMIDAGIDTPRKNAVLAVEIIFSLPPSWHDKDSSNYFEACFEWTRKNFLGEMLAFDVHLDEAAPHAHALILPLVNGRMNGSEMVGNTANLERLRNLLYSQVGGHYGLGRSGLKRLSGKDRIKLEEAVIQGLSDDCVMQSAIWTLVRDNIRQDPLPYAELLDIKKPARESKKHFIDYKRSRGRGAFDR